MTNDYDKNKVKAIVELSYALDESLHHAKSLLDVALTGDLAELKAHTQHDYLSILDDKIVVAMQAHGKIVSLCNSDNISDHVS